MKMWEERICVLTPSVEAYNGAMDFHVDQAALAVSALQVPPGFGLGGLPLSLALSTLMFFLAYRYVPRRRVGVGAALAGAVLASLLWEIAKQLFRLYIQEVSLYSQIYSPLGVLVAFVMFVYYSAAVFVLSGAFVAALDARRR